MNKQICIIILLLNCRICGAQNLVPNGDFEFYSGCPDDLSQIDSALFWMNPSTGAFPVGGTPDYFNQCSTVASGASVPMNEFGFQQAYSGNAYSGIYLWQIGGNNYREYIEVPLSSSLITNQCYHFEMYINLGNIFKYTSDNIAVYFSDTAVENINNWLPLPFIPQLNNANGNEPDTLNWSLVSGNYFANGGENYLIIGNYNDDSNTDTTIVNINAPPWGDGVYCYIDYVSLTICTGMNEQNNNASVNIYPNPFTDKLTFRNTDNELSEIILYDIVSRKLLQQKFTNAVSLNTEQLAKGLYLYEVRNKDGLCKKGKVVKE